MKILGKNVLIKPVKNAEFRVGKIIIPGTVELNEHRKNQEGIIAAIGSRITEALEYTKGSHVFVEMYSAKPMEYKGQEYFVVPQESVVGVAVGAGDQVMFKPIGNRIMLVPMPEDENSWLVLPKRDWSGDAATYEESDKGIPVRFMVMSVGTGVKNRKGQWRPFLVSPGQIVYCLPFVGRDVDTPEGTFKLVKERDILGVLESVNHG